MILIILYILSLSILNKSKSNIFHFSIGEMKMQQKLNFPFNVRKKKKKEIFESIQTVSLRIVQGPRYPFNRDRSATRAMANSIGSTKCWSPATPKRARFIASPHRLELINIPQKLSIPQNRIASFNRINRIFFFLNSNERRRNIFTREI